jgi:hypothetical protein
MHSTTQTSTTGIPARSLEEQKVCGIVDKGYFKYIPLISLSAKSTKV